jgi:hypothetical protein
MDQTGRNHLIHHRWLPDLLVVSGIVILWLAWLGPVVIERQPVAYDTYRDAAGAENVLAGRWLRDPCVADQMYWYAPLGPIFFAGVSKLTGAPPLLAYSRSILWLNVLGPIAWYLLARVCWGRGAGIAAVVLVWASSRWWSTHGTLPMTSIQGVILLLAVMIVWVLSVRCPKRVSALPVGLLLALCAWYHIISAMIASAAIGFHGLLGAKTRVAEDAEASAQPRPRRAESRWRTAIVATTGGVLVLPLAWHLLRLDRVNLEPITYIARELHDPAFTWPVQAMLIVPLAAIGLIGVCRQPREPQGVLIGYVVVSVIGTALGYARIHGVESLPVLIPHEFLWNLHLACGLMAGGGAWHVGRRLAARLRCIPKPARIPLFVLAIPVLLLGVHAAAARVGQAVDERDAYWRLTRLPQSLAETVSWIHQNTSIDDVFLREFSEKVNPYPLDAAFIEGHTGRKLVCPPPAYTNIAVSSERRQRDNRRLFATRDVAEFETLLDRYGVGYVLLVGRQLAHWERWRAWNVLEPAFRGRADRVLILGVPRSVDADPTP